MGIILSIFCGFIIGFSMCSLFANKTEHEQRIDDEAQMEYLRNLMKNSKDKNEWELDE